MTEHPQVLRLIALHRHLDAALKAFMADVGDTSPWPFMVDAVIFYSEGLSCSRPDLARPFLEALALRGTDDDIERINQTTDTILGLRIELIRALIARRDLAS